jgi:hypothetical protein
MGEGGKRGGTSAPCHVKFKKKTEKLMKSININSRN